MKTEHQMELRILLPYRVFLESRKVSRIVFSTPGGSYGLLPRRLDCVATLVPGIFMFETMEGEEEFIAVDQGILVKAGFSVSVSVRNALGGVPLGSLHKKVRESYLELGEQEQKARRVLEKIESGFLQSLEQLRNEQT